MNGPFFYPPNENDDAKGVRKTLAKLRKEMTPIEHKRMCANVLTKGIKACSLEVLVAQPQTERLRKKLALTSLPRLLNEAWEHDRSCLGGPFTRLGCVELPFPVFISGVLLAEYLGV